MGAFEINGQIDAEMFRHSLMTWGEKFSASEIDDAFGEFKIDGGMIDGAHLKSIMVAKKEGEEQTSANYNHQVYRHKSQTNFLNKQKLSNRPREKTSLCVNCYLVERFLVRQPIL